MHHVAKITFGKVENRPYHAECSCSTAGDFASHQEARDYLAMHLSRLQGINSAEFQDATVAPVPIPQPEKVPEQEEPAKVEPQPEEKAEAAGE
jgi:hypothetical protein